MSRIWGGIHPPADDLPGIIIGEEIGVEAFAFAEQYFNSTVTGLKESSFISTVYPNPANDRVHILLPNHVAEYVIEVFDMSGSQVMAEKYRTSSELRIDTSHLIKGNYIMSIKSRDWTSNHMILKR